MDQTAPRKLSKKGSAALLQAGPVCCYMSPVTNGTADEQIVITGSGLSAYDAQGKYLYPCTVWTTAQDYAKGAYGTFLASRVRDVINGQAALAVVGGGVSVESMSSLIAQSAGQLLHAINPTDSKEGTVTLSWFRLGAQSTESIVDVLRAASPSGSTSAGPAHTLREVGSGRGMAVPGIWEVEVASAADVTTILQHVGTAQAAQQTQAARAAEEGAFHTILQLHCKRTSSAAPVGVLSVVLLSPLAKPLNTQNPRIWHPWVEMLSMLLNWSNPSPPPYHKSRLALLLRDALQGRQAVSYLLVLVPEQGRHAENMKWLGLMDRLQSAGNAGGAGGAGSNPSPTTIHSVSQSRIRDKADLPRANSTSRLGGRTSPGVHHQSAAPTPVTPRNINSTDLLDFSPIPRNNYLPVPHPGQHPQQTGREEPSTTRTRSSSGNPVPGPASGREDPSSSPTPYMTPSPSYEEYTALSLALEASRSEGAALRLAYGYEHDRYTALKEAHDKVMGQLSEDGAMLGKRDQMRYKAALKDLRDYEIYKQVMEAAMTKMQSELEAYAKENQDLKAAARQETHVLSKQRTTTDRAVKDSVLLKKRVDELEPKLIAEEKRFKTMSRERDAAVAALAQSQGTLASKLAQAEAVAGLRTKDAEDLQRRVKALEDRCKSLENEKDILLATHATEVDGLRNAHSKALETLMTYQEENDQLRSGMADAVSGGLLSREPSRQSSLSSTAGRR